eukprot:5427518-Karenia_brevis.AAC.1
MQIWIPQRSGRLCLDVYPIEENGTFYRKEGPERHAAVWEMVTDREIAARLEDHHVMNHYINLLEESDPWCKDIKVPWIRRLVQPTKIRHSVMIPIDRKGRILFRYRKGGQFTKMLGGGGQVDLSIIQAHYHCRAGLEDEYNIGSVSYTHLTLPTICSV